MSILGLLFSGISVLSVAPTVDAAKSGCGQTITTSITLTSDIGPCAHKGIIIGASGITLDCAGHTISGTGQAKDGILINFQWSRVTIKNCVVTGFEFGVRIKSSGLDNISANTANGNTYGFYTNAGGEAYFHGNIANNNINDGFYLFRTQYATLTGNTANGNGGSGFYSGAGAQRNTFTGNTADSNNMYGYYEAITRRTQVYNNDECRGNLLGGSSPMGLCSPQA